MKPSASTYHGVAVSVGEIEGERGEVGHFLNGIGRDDQRAVVAVAAAFDHLDVVALFGRDVAETGTAAHDVGDDAGEFGSGQVAEAFLHEADAGAARRASWSVRRRRRRRTTY